MSSAEVLMCPPDYYGIDYEINPWMSRGRPSDPARAMSEWRALKELLELEGAAVHCLAPVEGLPDLVFTANAALVDGRVAVLSRFRHPQRQGEEQYNEAWFAGHGFEIRRPPPDSYFEGAGDALFCGETLLAGYRIRSDIRGYQEIGRQVGRRAIESLIPELIPVEESEAQTFACNAVVVGRTVITNVGCPRLHRQLADRGFTPRETPLDEFVKAGGSAKCLTLRLDGEEAAPWKAPSLR
jgi:N-dimethylarginine dimethylaminohydrolase